MSAMPPCAEPAEPGYIEFGVQSNFSFLRGASRPEELVVVACLFGHAGMGLADRNSVAGVVRAWSQSKFVHIEDKETSEKSFGPVRLPYHPGCRLVFGDGTPDVLAYPRDREGWGHLCRMLTQANLREETRKGTTLLRRADLFEWGDRLSLAVLPDLSPQARGEVELLCQFRQRFGPALRLAVAPLYRGDDRFRIDQAAAMAAAVGLPLMATNDVLYHEAGRRPLQDVLTAIRLNVPVAEAGLALAANAERHLKPPVEMARLFCGHEQALAETLRFASELTFSLKELEHNYPEETSEAGIDPQTELERLTWEGAHRRYPGGIPQKIRDMIPKELSLIEEKKYARYFLTVNDIVRFAREEAKVLCQGRGSAANSIVCFCLGITEVDPVLMKMDLLLGRFISTERDEPPDIDVDFEHEKRETIIAYIYEKYSAKRTALAAAVVSYRGRSALREVAKAMGLSEDARSALSGSIWGWRSSRLGEQEARAGGLAPEHGLSRHVIGLANAIMGFPRHLTQHVGGFVITRDRLDEIVPIVKTAMDERRMVEWDKDDLDAVGILKVDVLALGMLSCIRRAFDLLERHYEDARDDYGRPYGLATLPAEEPDVYDMICRADTLGVFQIESRAQMSMLPRLKPREFYDLVIEVAIVRPGPIQGDMVHPYLRRRMGKEQVDYPSPVLQTILERTLGIPLFQEQAMKIAIEAAGFSPGKADQLRRSMATFRRNGTIDNHRRDFIDGMVENGYDRDFAERCFKQIEGFGDYGFPESHAASFALLVYASCWLKTFYPDVFCAAILNSQPMGFYQPAQLVRDARDHGVEVRAVDVNGSNWDCTLEEAPFDPERIIGRHRSMRGVIRTRHAVRLGFRQIKGLSRDRMAAFVERRGDGYVSVRDVWLRSGLDIGEIEKLAGADAFRSLGLDRRAALWAVRALDGSSAAEKLPLFDRPHVRLRELEPAAVLPIMPPGEQVVHDYRSLGLSLKAHPVGFLRARLDCHGVTPNVLLSSVKDGRRVRVAGLVLVRQRPGKGNAIFLTLEDEKAIANVIFWPRVFERFRPVVMGARFVCVSGKLQSESDVIHIVAGRIDDLTPWLASLREGASPAVEDIQGGLPRGTAALAKETRQVMPKGRNFQ